jgi:uncharacterized protein (UPF0335 family)
MAEEITETSQTVAAGRRRAFIGCSDRLEVEKKTVAGGTEDIHAEAKGAGSSHPQSRSPAIGSI